MPTTPGTRSAPLTPQQTLEKVSSLITEIGDDKPESPEPAVAAPEVPAPEQAPPAPSDKPDAPVEPVDEDDTPVEVKVDGEPVQVSLAELKRNYSSHAHNTQRAQELSEREKRLEPEIRQRLDQEVSQERAEYRDGLAKIRQALEQLHGEPDWVTVRTQVSDAEFLKRKADWETQKAQTLRLKAAEEDVAQRDRAAQTRQYQDYLRAEEDKLKAAVPEWTDTAKGQTEIAKLASFAKAKYGIPDAQIAQAFTSAAAILIVRDAMRYAELHREPNAQAKARSPQIKAAKPGSPERPRPNAVQQKLIEQTKSGRQRDAMQAIAAMLPDD